LAEPSNVCGPVQPTLGASTILAPLGLADARITSGLWAARQRVNRDVSIPNGARRLHDAGNVDDLAMSAAGTESQDDYHGPVFMDSDVYKWLEAVAWEYARQPSDELAEQFATTSAAVAAAQEDDGYLNSYVQVTRGGRERYRDLSSSHELYCLGHLIQAAIASRRAGLDDTLWKVAITAADHLVATFGPDGVHDIDGHPIIEMALVELYRDTGDERYLDLAHWFVDFRGHGTNDAYGREPIYFSDRVPALEATTVEGHAVRALYFAAGVCDVAVERGRAGERYLEAQARQWDHMVATKTYVTGGLGSRWDGEAFGDPYELPPDVAYCETCAAIGGVQWTWRRLLHTGDVRCADLIERILFNGFLSATSLSGNEFFYANALQVRTGAIPDDHRQPANGRGKWFHVACCPPNIMRTVSSIAAYLATRDAEGMQLHVYANAEIEADRRRVSVATDYPWDGRVVVTIAETDGDDWTLALRVPSWAETATVTVNDEPADRRTGYARLRRQWQPGDRVVLELPMPVRLTAADPRVDAVRGARAIQRGPIVYAIEQVDLPDGVMMEDIELVAGATATVDWPATRRREFLEDVVTIAVPLRDRRTGRDFSVAAVPYFAWDNRGVGPMRVWMPLPEKTP
jgi:DUF1680 family protein